MKTGREVDLTLKTEMRNVRGADVRTPPHLLTCVVPLLNHLLRLLAIPSWAGQESSGRRRPPWYSALPLVSLQRLLSY